MRLNLARLAGSDGGLRPRNTRLPALSACCGLDRQEIAHYRIDMEE